MPCFATPPSAQLDNLQSTVSLYNLINIFTNVYPTWRIFAISCTSNLSENKYLHARDIAENRYTVLAKPAHLKYFHIWYLWLTAAETQFSYDGNETLIFKRFRLFWSRFDSSYCESPSKCFVLSNFDIPAYHLAGFSKRLSTVTSPVSRVPPPPPS